MKSVLTKEFKFDQNNLFTNTFKIDMTTITQK